MSFYLAGATSMSTTSAAVIQEDHAMKKKEAVENAMERIAK